MSAEPERAQDVEQALAEALAERNRLWAQLHEQRADQRELEYLRRELKTIHGSTMWKIAGHYQRIKQLIRVGLERLRGG